jgi:hypothetical protein
MNAHEEVLALIPGYPELSAHERRAIDAHAETCEQCAAALDRQRQLRSEIAHAPRLSPDPAKVEAVRAASRRKASPRSTSASVARRPRWVKAIAPAGVITLILVLVGAWAIWQGQLLTSMPRGIGLANPTVSPNVHVLPNDDSINATRLQQSGLSFTRADPVQVKPNITREQAISEAWENVPYKSGGELTAAADLGYISGETMISGLVPGRLVWFVGFAGPGIVEYSSGPPGVPHKIGHEYVSIIDATSGAVVVEMTCCTIHAQGVMPPETCVQPNDVGPFTFSCEQALQRAEEAAKQSQPEMSIREARVDSLRAELMTYAEANGKLSAEHGYRPDPAQDPQELVWWVQVAGSFEFEGIGAAGSPQNPIYEAKERDYLYSAVTGREIASIIPDTALTPPDPRNVVPSLPQATPVPHPASTSVATPVPTPHSPLIGSFVWQTDGAFGYQMLRPAGWEAKELGDTRQYVAPGPAIRPDWLALEAVNYQARFSGERRSEAASSWEYAAFEQNPTLEGWSSAVEQKLRSLDAQPELVRSLPDVRVYTARKDDIGSLSLMALKVEGGQPLDIRLWTSGTYADVDWLKNQGVLDDFVTMVASARAFPENPQYVMPPLSALPTPTAPYPAATPIATHAPESTATLHPTPLWEPYQAALLQAILLSEPPEGVCEWAELGRSAREVYVWAYCTGYLPGGIRTAASVPAVMTLADDGRPTAVRVPGDGSLFEAGVRSLFPAEVQALILGGALYQTTIPALEQHALQRLASPQLPPLAAEEMLAPGPTSTFASVPTATIVASGATPIPTPLGDGPFVTREGLSFTPPAT